MNTVLETEHFRRIFRKLDNTKQIQVEKVKDQLEDNLLIGDRIQYEWFREKRVLGERVFFVINRVKGIAVLIAYGGKGVQDDIIDHVLDNKEEYLDLVE